MGVILPRWTSARGALADKEAVDKGCRGEWPGKPDSGVRITVAQGYLWLGTHSCRLGHGFLRGFPFPLLSPRLFLPLNINEILLPPLFLSLISLPIPCIFAYLSTRPVLGSRDTKMTGTQRWRVHVGNKICKPIMSTHNKRKAIKETYLEDSGGTAGTWQLFLGELWGVGGGLVEELMYETVHEEE